MMGLGWQELLIVLVIVMIIFGAGKLTQVGTALGRGVKEFKLEAVGGEPRADVSAETVGNGDGSALGPRGTRADMI